MTAQADHERPYRDARSIRCSRCRAVHICIAPLIYCFCPFCDSDHVETM